jgi:hypothetical protein
MIGTAIASDDGNVPIPCPKDGFSLEWWEKHMDELERWNVYNARTAEATGVDYLLVQPAISAYPVEEYNNEQYPNYNQRMNEIIKKMRNYYSNKLVAEMVGLPGVDTTYSIDYCMDADIVSAQLQESWDRVSVSTSQEEANRIIAEDVDKYSRASELSGKRFIMQQLSVGSLDYPNNPSKEQIENH